MADFFENCPKHHWQVERIRLQRLLNTSPPSNSTGEDPSWGFTISGGTDAPFLDPQFTSIIVTKILNNNSIDPNESLQVYDLILRVNDVDLSNASRAVARQAFREAGERIELLIRRLCPTTREEIDIKHRGKLHFSFIGGIGDQHYPDDAGIFISQIDPKKTDPHIRCRDRLLSIASKSVTYDLRFVTRDIARRRIKAAMKQSQRVRLTVAHSQEIPIKPLKETNIANHLHRRTTQESPSPEERRSSLPSDLLPREDGDPIRINPPELNIPSERSLPHDPSTIPHENQNEIVTLTPKINSSQNISTRHEPIITCDIGVGTDDESRRRRRLTREEGANEQWRSPSPSPSPSRSPSPIELRTKFSFFIPSLNEHCRWITHRTILRRTLN